MARTHRVGGWTCGSPSERRSSKLWRRERLHRFRKTLNTKKIETSPLLFPAMRFTCGWSVRIPRSWNDNAWGRGWAALTRYHEGERVKYLCLWHGCRSLSFLLVPPLPLSFCAKIDISEAPSFGEPAFSDPASAWVSGERGTRFARLS